MDSSSTEAAQAVEQKALQINLDSKIYGTLAEIGAGQEVARIFFRVGGAAGTVAKTICAYDMTFSDEIYGKTSRYVSRDRLDEMLTHEYALLIERLGEKRGAQSSFFVFADTVSARNYQGTNECHGWLGVRFQASPGEAPNDIIIHVRMNDRTNALQQQALGLLGVNLVYGAFFERADSNRMIESLFDGLSIERIEVDLIEVSGPAFQGIDNRILSLKLIQFGLTKAVLLSPDRTVLQPSEALRKRPIVVTRGVFRPVTNLNVDMVNCVSKQIAGERSPEGKDPVTVFEVGFKSLCSGNQGGAAQIDDADFLARADSIAALGYPLLVTDFPHYYEITTFLSRYTQEIIAVTLSVETLLQVFDAKEFENLDGGVFEALARLFKKRVKVFVYPSARTRYLDASDRRRNADDRSAQENVPEIVALDDIQLSDHFSHLLAYLKESRSLVSVSGFSKQLLSIASRDVLEKIQRGDENWESLVPRDAANLIRERRAFGLSSAV